MDPKKRWKDGRRDSRNKEGERDMGSCIYPENYPGVLERVAVPTD